MILEVKVVPVARGLSPVPLGQLHVAEGLRLLVWAPRVLSPGGHIILRALPLRFPEEGLEKPCVPISHHVPKHWLSRSGPGAENPRVVVQPCRGHPEALDMMVPWVLPPQDILGFGI